MTVTRTQVGIVGGGPAGLMLSHLLRRAGIDSVVVEARERSVIESTNRAGILERDSVRMLVDTGVSDRVLTDGHEHRGINLRFDGVNHLVNFQELIGASTWLYPQTDVFIDLANAHDRDGGDVRFGVQDTDVADVTGQPRITYTDAAGTRHEIRCDVLVGADGSRSITRAHVVGHTPYFKEYPFAWFGIMCEAPPSADELIYAHSERGFVLASQRTETVQRMYFQCDPQEKAENWTDEQIWAEMRARIAGQDGFELKEGPIFEKTVLPFRSFVCEPMRHGNLLLAGDAAHTVPPTGAKGLNLALADVGVLAEVLERHFGGEDGALDEYGPRALSRVWKAQHFSYWMTSMLHSVDGATDFDVKRQLGELSMVVGSERGSSYLAEAYTGWPED
jgi:p-hydroxybenzoate 3-monooxygenase